MGESKSINWINVLKALCILFVFLRHSENFYGADLGWFDSLYLPFYVNAFFFISGYLLFWKQLSSPRIKESRNEYLYGGGRKLLSNIVYRIVIPSIIFSTIEFLPKKIIKGDDINIPDFLVETVGGCTYWFTSALVVAEVLFLILFLTRRQTIWFYVIIAFTLSFIGWYLSIKGFSFVYNFVSLPWQYKQGLICMCYMALGGLYWRYERILVVFFKKEILLLVTIVYLAGSILFRPYLYSGYMTSLELIHPFGVIWSLLASMLLIEVCKRIPKIQFLTFIGQNSIGFYFMSGALPIVFSILVHKLFTGTFSWAIFLIFIGSIFVSYYVMKMLVKWTPFLFDIRILRNK